MRPTRIEQGSYLDFENSTLLRHVCLSGWTDAGYRELIMQTLPQICVLDGLDRLGDPSHPNLVSPCDIPGLEDYVDLLQSSDTSRNEAVFSCFNFKANVNLAGHRACLHSVRFFFLSPWPLFVKVYSLFQCMSDVKTEQNK